MIQKGAVSILITMAIIPILGWGMNNVVGNKEAISELRAFRKSDRTIDLEIKQEIKELKQEFKELRKEIYKWRSNK